MTTYPFVRPIDDDVLALADVVAPIVRLRDEATRTPWIYVSSESYDTVPDLLAQVRAEGNISDDVPDIHIILNLTSSHWRLGEPVSLDEVLMISAALNNRLTEEFIVDRALTIGEIAYAVARARSEIMAFVYDDPQASTTSPLTHAYGELPRRKAPHVASLTKPINLSCWGNGVRENTILIESRKVLSKPSALLWLWASRYLFDDPTALLQERFASGGDKWVQAESLLCEKIVDKIASFDFFELHEVMPFLLAGVNDPDVIAGGFQEDITLDFLLATQDGETA